MRQCANRYLADVFSLKSRRTSETSEIISEVSENSDSATRSCIRFVTVVVFERKTPAEGFLRTSLRCRVREK
jgi:hypothetical protein